MSKSKKPSNGFSGADPALLRNPVSRVSALFLWMSFAGANAGILYFSLLPYDDLPDFILRIKDLAAHFTGYFILFFVSVSTFRVSRLLHLYRHPVRNAFFWNLTLGLLTEWAQFHVPGRYPGWPDVAANFAGGVSSWAGMNLLRRWNSKRSR